jgi:hypothetical protein
MAPVRWVAGSIICPQSSSISVSASGDASDAPRQARNCLSLQDYMAGAARSVDGAAT